MANCLYVYVSWRISHIKVTGLRVKNYEKSQEPRNSLILNRECFVDWWRDVAHETLALTLKDVIIGFPERKDILNYLLILSKSYVWECRRSNCFLKFNLSLYMIELKKDSENHIAVKNRTLNDFNKDRAFSYTKKCKNWLATVTLG